MKFLYILLLVLSTVFAQTREEILSYEGSSLGRDSEQQIRKSQEILDIVERLSAETKFRPSRLNDRQGTDYPVLVVEASRGSDLNTEASRVAKEFFGLPLVFSPYDLGRAKAAAFFDPNGSKLGVSYKFALGDVTDSSYLHELFHASTQRDIIQGKANLWAGLMQTEFNYRMTTVNFQYYQRFASLDELPATALSAQLDSQKIIKMRATLPAREFGASRGPGERLLGEIHLSAVSGKYLALQSKDIATRALSKISSVEKSSTELQMGTASITAETSLFKLDAFTRKFVNGNGQNVAVPEKTEFKLYWSKSTSSSELEARLREIVARSAAAEVAFQKLEKCISVLIEFVEVAKTDFKCIEQNGPEAFKALVK